MSEEENNEELNKFEEEEFEPDPDVLKENIVEAKQKANFFGKMCLKYLLYAAIFIVIGIVFNELNNNGVINLPYEIAVIERIKIVPLLISFAPLGASSYNLIKFNYYQSGLDLYKKNLEKIAPLQINLGNEKLIEEMKAIVSPKKIEKVKPPKKHNISKKQTEEGMEQ